MRSYPVPNDRSSLGSEFLRDEDALNYHAGVYNIPDCFSHETLLRIYRGVVFLRDMWVQRDPEWPWYTLGPAAYLDAHPERAGTLENYMRKCSRENPIMMACFHEAYEELIDGLDSLLNSGVMLAENYARPGFHIFKSHPAFERTGGHIHYDLEYQLLQWGSGVTSQLPHFSLTLPIVLPSEGGGLNVWDKEGSMNTIEYVPGDGYIHFGELKHQIAQGGNMGFMDERITMQLHGVLVDGIWRVYR